MLVGWLVPFQHKIGYIKDKQHTEDIVEPSFPAQDYLPVHHVRGNNLK